MELALNPTNRHVQDAIINTDASNVGRLSEFSHCTEQQTVESNLDVTLANIKREHNFEPGEVLWKTEPYDWSNENLEVQDSVETAELTNKSFILRHLLSQEKAQTESNIDSIGLEDDLTLEPGESLIRLKLEPEEIAEMINTNPPPLPEIPEEPREATCPGSANVFVQNCATVSLENASRPEKNSNDLEITSVLQNGVPILPTDSLVPTEKVNEERSLSSTSQSVYAQSHFKVTLVCRPNDAAFAQSKLSAKLIHIKNIPFAVEVTCTYTRNSRKITPFYKRCKVCGDSFFLDLNHFIDHLRHHRYSKMYCMICQRGLSGQIYAEKHAEIHQTNHLECNECFRFFPTKAKLKTHKLTHKGHPPFRCENCPLKFFLTFQQTKKHIKKCSGVMFKCSRCKLEYQSRNELEKHPCAAVGFLECQKCLKIFKSEQDLENHMKKHKNVIRLVYECKLCKALYNSYHEFLVHRVSHVLEYCKNLQKCQICHKNFPRLHELRQHVKLHSQKKYHCALCHIGYTRQKHVIHHLKVHELQYRQCHQCFYFYKDQRELKYHERKHRMGPPFFCEHCPKLQFKSFIDISKHINNTHLIYKCGTCGKKFKLLSKLSLHNQTHEKKYSCRKCGKKFARVDYLAKHKTIHTKLRAYKCPECKHKFSRSDNFKVHLKKMHKSDKTYSCVCGMKFSHKVLYSMHKNVHRGKLFICDFCQGKFKIFAEMKKHIMIDHLKMSKYTCDVCKEDFLNHDSLITHYDKRHKNISSVCDVCGKGFESYSKLKMHKDAHEVEVTEAKAQPVLKKKKPNKEIKRKVLGSPPYECYHCKSTFNAMRLLKHHILTKHLNADEFECNLCGQKFLSVVSLRNHYCNSHKNENVICDKCGSHFKKYGDFLRHNRVHENGKARNCGKCRKKFSTAAELKRHYLNTHRTL